ncbi:DUF2855 family protein [Ningiella sp. W23]|uniref:DUF2855 family protein n=1 Tax=Ningiella sp. W23 TaxID=3023715 RepID=UPI0037580EBF
MQITQIQVRKNNLDDVETTTLEFEPNDLSDGEIVLATQSFGFSANNITYAALGEGMGYWGFFPASKDPSAWGVVPVWGFAQVTHSNHDQIAVGEKVFGYLPMASHLIVRPGKIGEYGFSDTHPQRKSISPVYDSYLYCKKDPGYNAQRESWQLNFRPLFMTSFVLDEFVAQYLSQNGQQDIERDSKAILLSSASSKTALGTAFLLQANRQERPVQYQIIGLTSPNNVEFTKGLGCYDLVYSYDQLTSLPNAKSWLLDFAANGSLIAGLQSKLGENLEKVTLIGATDWKAQVKPNKKALDAEIFFAPHWVKELNQSWGQATFLQKYAAAWANVAGKLEDQMHETQINGVDSIISLYKETLEGRADTKALNVVSF